MREEKGGEEGREMKSRIKRKYWERRRYVAEGREERRTYIVDWACVLLAINTHSIG